MEDTNWGDKLPKIDCGGKEMFSLAVKVWPNYNSIAGTAQRRGGEWKRGQGGGRASAICCVLCAVSFVLCASVLCVLVAVCCVRLYYVCGVFPVLTQCGTPSPSPSPPGTSVGFMVVLPDELTAKKKLEAAEAESRKKMEEEREAAKLKKEEDEDGDGSDEDDDDETKG